MLITQEEIAREANVSRSTVAAVMAGAQRISPEVRSRVREVAERLNYRPNRYAQVMSNGKSGLIGIINFGARLYLAQNKMQMAAELILREKYEAMVQEALWFSKMEGDAGRFLCQRMIDARVEGVLLLYPNALWRQEHLDQLLQAGIPVVTIAGEQLRKIPCFVSDREWGYHALTRHLLDAGRRRLACLASDTGYAEKGFRRALEESPRKAEAAEILYPRQMLPEGTPLELVPYLPGQIGVDEILARGFNPDAMVCNNDTWALGALSACAGAGLRVPEDLALTGFDNEPAARFGTVAITTIDHPARQISEQAVECLLTMIRKRRKPVGRTIKTRGELIVRQSCGTASG